MSTYPRAVQYKAFLYTPSMRQVIPSEDIDKHKECQPPISFHSKSMMTSGAEYFTKDDIISPVLQKLLVV